MFVQAPMMSLPSFNIHICKINLEKTYFILLMMLFETMTIEERIAVIKE